ncbi:hypothetical protein L596_015844 [Steinernema carpocapsae]|uniref:Transthyretin-like family protein n=1 Tax=Steinernema carpocapsae TaxID=34508 RepID=A0A4U5NGC2_STECR|nr:hypothetical protein L596_015844 [Steinernema carpocapsae]
MRTLLLLSVLLGLFVFTSTQITEAVVRSVGVNGKVLCGGQPAEGVKIRLFRTKNDDLKDMLDYKTTGSDGRFSLEGNTAGRSVDEADLIPTVRVYHNCDEDPKKAKGFRTFIMNIPKDFVTLGRIPRNAYDAGAMNLQVIFPKEGREKKFKESAKMF